LFNYHAETCVPTTGVYFTCWKAISLFSVTYPGLGTQSQWPGEHLASVPHYEYSPNKAVVETVLQSLGSLYLDTCEIHQSWGTRHMDVQIIHNSFHGTVNISLYSNWRQDLSIRIRKHVQRRRRCLL
jgi:hypothetical protein